MIRRCHLAIIAVWGNSRLKAVSIYPSTWWVCLFCPTEDINAAARHWIKFYHVKPTHSLDPPNPTSADFRPCRSQIQIGTPMPHLLPSGPSSALFACDLSDGCTFCRILQSHIHAIPLPAISTRIITCLLGMHPYQHPGITEALSQWMVDMPWACSWNSFLSAFINAFTFTMLYPPMDLFLDTCFNQAFISV